MPAEFDSPWYPYRTTVSPCTTLRGAETIPYKLLMYLLDLPDAQGYRPQDDNERPRVRFAKLVWYDGERPLDRTLPTPEQKLSMLFDPDVPDINTDEAKAKHPKGYRLLWQKVRGQSLLEAQTLVKCYIGRVFSPRPYHTTIGIRFDITTNVDLETNTRTDRYQRCFDIEQSIREALAPIDMTGVGSFSFLRSDHADNGSFILWDEATQVGRTLHCSIDWVDPNDGGVDGACEVC